LMYPEDELGSEFWSRVYEKANKLYGTTDIPMNTFNKIWIVPDDATVFENEQGAFVLSSHLKVMLEEDYLTLQKNLQAQQFGTDQLLPEDVEAISGVSSEVVREVLLPEIEKEVNEGKTFANLRQIYNSMILATWYKQNLKESIFAKVYVDKNKTKGVDVKDKAINQKIYNQYLEAFKKGVYDYIKEDYDPTTKQIIPRKYFSGGTALKDTAMLVETRKVTAASFMRMPPSRQREMAGLIAEATATEDAWKITVKAVPLGFEADEALLSTQVAKAERALFAEVDAIAEEDAAADADLAMFAGMFDRAYVMSIGMMDIMQDAMRRSGAQSELIERELGIYRQSPS